MTGYRETEEEWQAWVIELAQVLGWEWGHISKGRVVNRGGEDRWVTPVHGPLGLGHPDLILARERVVYVECKSNTGKLRKAQRAWIRRMRDAGAEVYVWRPRDRQEVERTLK